MVSVETVDGGKLKEAATKSQAIVAESFMDDEIETSQSSQESESDHDIGRKATTYSTQVQD